MAKVKVRKEIKNLPKKIVFIGSVETLQEYYHLQEPFRRANWKVFIVNSFKEARKVRNASVMVVYFNYDLDLEVFTSWGMHYPKILWICDYGDEIVPKGVKVTKFESKHLIPSMLYLSAIGQI